MHIWFYTLKLSANKLIILLKISTLTLFSSTYSLLVFKLIIISWDKCMFSNIQNTVKPLIYFIVQLSIYHRSGSMCETFICCFICLLKHQFYEILLRSLNTSAVNNFTTESKFWKVASICFQIIIDHNLKRPY